MKNKMFIVFLIITILAILAFICLVLFKEKPQVELDETFALPTNSEEQKQFTKEFSSSNIPYEFFKKREEVVSSFIPIEEIKEQFEQELFFENEEQDGFDGNKIHAIMTNEEYFSKVYPDSYTEALNVMQDLMLDDNYIQETEKVVFKTEEDTYPFFMTSIDFMADKEYLDEEKREPYKYGMDVVLRELNALERPLVEKRLFGISLRRIMKDIAIFFVPEAQALLEVDIGVECYRMGTSLGAALPGFNAAAPGACCNCGFTCGPESCWFVPKCGPMGGICNVGSHLGCLNAICMGSPAIWDPMTNICGCGSLPFMSP